MSFAKVKNSGGAMSGLSLIDVWYRRLPRYLFIEDRLQDQSVLELGCGSGLGADFLIEQGAGRVVGVDTDERQILKARARYKRPNLSFEVAVGADLPFADGEFGLVLIPEGSRAIGDGALLAAVRRVLRPDGLCLVAVPNGDLEEPEPEGLSYYDMIESLEPVFPSVTMVAQTPMFAFTFVDFLASAEELDVGLDDSLAQDLVDDVAFYVALCSKEPYSPEVFSITQIPFAPVARRVQHLLDGQPPEQLELAQLQEALAAEREERIRLDDASGDLERDLLETQNIMRDLRARLAAADDQKVEAEAHLEPLKAELGDATRAADAQRAVAQELERELDGLRDQAGRYAKQAEAAGQELEEARRAAGELQQRAESHSEALLEMEALRSRSDRGERDQAELSARLAQERERVHGLEAECQEAKESLEGAESELLSVRDEQEKLGQRSAQVQRELDEVGQSLEQRDRRIAEVERELGEVREGADQGEQRIEGLERELGEVRAAADVGGHRIVELERELGAVRDQAEDGSHRTVKLERELGEARGEVEQRGQRLGELERELGESNEAVDRTGQRAVELERELEAARAEGEGRGSRVGELEQELDEVRSEAEQRGNRVGELEWLLGEARGEGENLVDRVGELERELDEARGEAEQRKERIGELKREVELAQSRAEGFGGRIGELEMALDSLRSEAGQEREQSATRIEQLREQIAEAEAALGAAQQQCSGLEERLVTQREKVEGLESRLRDTEAAQGGAEVLAAGLTEDLVRVRQELEEGLGQREAAEDEVRRTRERLDAAQERFAEAQEEQAAQLQRLEAMEAGLDSSREEVRTLQAVTDQANQEAADREEALSGAMERVADLSGQLDQVSDQADATTADMERLGQQLLAADEERAAQDGQRRGLDRDLATALADRLSLEVRLEQALIRADQSEVTGAELRTRKEDLESRLIGELEDARTAQAETRSELEQQRTELEQQRTSGARSEEDLSAARSELEQQRTELEQQRASGAQSEEDLSASRSELEQQRTELEAVQAAGREQGATNAAQSDQQQTSLREVEAHASALEERVQGLMIRLTDQESQTHGEQDRMRSVADALAARETVVEAVQAQLAAEQAHGSAREGQLAEAQQELSSLERSLEQERQVREEIERSLDAVESSMGDLSRAGDQAVLELAAARHDAAVAAGETTRWQQQCAEAQRELQQVSDQAVALEAAREAVDMDETVGQLRSELKSVRDQGAALGAERARLMRQASLAADSRDAVAQRLAVAERAYGSTARGMELVIARLESERERADGLDREIRELRARVEERGEFTVRVTREAAAEAQRARQYRRDLAETSVQAESLRVELDRRTAELQSTREELQASAAMEPDRPETGAELASVIRRLEVRTTALQAAQVTIGELGDRVGGLMAEQQELRRAHAAAVQADQGVSDWDAEIQQGKVQALESKQAELLDKLQERTRAQRDLESRLQRQDEHVKELLAGAEHHRLEMADREISLAEQAAWNAELVATRQQTDQDIVAAREERERCDSGLLEAQTEAKQLGSEIARLEGELIRRVAELEEVRKGAVQESAEATAPAVDIAEMERALEAALHEAAAFRQRLEDSRQTHFEQVDRIEELEALLELAKHAKSRGMASLKKRETLIGVGADTVEIPPYKPAPQAPTVGLEALRSALDEVGQLEKTCQMEEERIGVLATSLARLGAQAGRLQEQLVSERLKMAEVEQQRRDLANQASRLPELELELDMLRTRFSAEGAGEQVGRAEAAERLLLEQRILGDESAEHTERRITELNNTIGDKDAEILLLHASMESMQRRARQLAGNIQEALRGAAAPVGGSAEALLDRVKAELEGLTKKG
jgi:chromosome segregation ATPase